MGQSASDVRAGGAYYELFGKDGLTPVLDKLKANWIGLGQVFASVNPLKEGGGFLGRADTLAGGLIRTLKVMGSESLAAGSKLAKIGAGLSLAGGAVAAPLLGLFKGGLERAADLAKLSRATGLPIQGLNKLKYAADAAGVSLDEVGQDYTGRYSDLIARAPAIDPADAKAAAEAELELSDAVRSLQDALLPLIQTVAPYVKMLAGWVKENAHLLAVAVPVAAALVGLGLAFSIGAVAIGGWVVAVKAALITVGAVLSAVLSPLAVLPIAVGALAYAFFTLTDAGKAAGEEIKGELSAAFQTAKSTFGGLANAIRKGDLNGAMEIATTGIELLWASAFAKIEKAWIDFKTPFVEGWHRLTDGLGAPLAALWSDLTSGFTDTWAKVKFAFAQVQAWWGQAVDQLGKIWDGIREPIMRVFEMLKPALAVIALPFILAVAGIRAAWDGLDGNIAITLNRLAKAVSVVYTRITGEIENAFKTITQAVIESVLRAAKALDALDPTGKLKGAIATVEEFNAALGRRRDVDKEVEAIEYRHSVIEKDLRNEQVKGQQAREQGDAAAMKASAEKVAALRAQLDADVGKANEPKLPGKEGPQTPLAPGIVPQVSVKGGFSSSALNQQFGYGDQLTKQTEYLKAISTGTGGLAENIAIHLGAVVAGRFRINN